MSFLFEISMITVFTVADFIWLIKIWKITSSFSFSEKMRSVTFTLAFLFIFFWMATERQIIGAAFSLIGYTVSQFTVAATFYDSCKELEIPYE